MEVVVVTAVPVVEEEVVVASLHVPGGSVVVAHLRTHYRGVH